jgi:hypothetical protein
MNEHPVLCVISIKASGLIVAVTVNDVTVYRNDDASQEHSAAKLNPLISPGTNRVAVSLGFPQRVAPLGAKKAAHGPAASPPSETASSINLTIQAGKQGFDPGTSGILVQYQWDRAPTPLPTADLRTVHEETFECPPLPWDGPLWKSTPVLQPDATAITTLVRRYAEALRTGDAAGASRLVDLKFQEMARSLGLDASEVQQNFREYLTRISGAADWSVRVAPELRFVLEAGAKIVRVTSPAGSAPISALSGGRNCRFDVTVIFHQGRWQIVR